MRLTPAVGSPSARERFWIQTALIANLGNLGGPFGGSAALDVNNAGDVAGYSIPAGDPPATPSFTMAALCSI